MANKIFLICTTLALCFLLTNASSYRTIVQFDEGDDTNPMGPYSRYKKCQREFQQEKHLPACQRWIRRQMREISCPYPQIDGDEFENPQQRHPKLQKCCNELLQEDTDCVCPTLRRAARAVELQGEQSVYETSKIYITASDLPVVCNIPGNVCPFGDSPFPPC